MICSMERDQVVRKGENKKLMCHVYSFSFITFDLLAYNPGSKVVVLTKNTLLKIALPCNLPSS